ncbi:MAG: DUF2961 domain-containing protein [Candidatus Latescibacterota bacterium]|jgi:hypothetical protein
MNVQELAAVVLTIVALPLVARAQPFSEGPLGDLYLARSGGIAHYSSTDETGGNDDRRPISPGETLVLVDHSGPGVVRRWWITIDPRDNVEVLRRLIVRCYWDGESDPSVEVPVADFFGMGFGEWKDYISMPLNMTSGGYNTYWPMPFREAARITVENTGSVPVASFYYNIDIRTYDELADEALYFHAQYRQVRTRAGEPVTILETTGRGHYVGTVLSVQPERGKNFSYLEGDERIYIDGEESPSIVGTGTEDYFSSGWYYITGEYSAPYHGVTIKDDDHGRTNSYRWHIEDPIPFKKSLRFNIEHGWRNDNPDVEYSSVAFWYQTHPHSSFPELPDNLVPLSKISTPSIEAEDLIERVSVTGGELRIQEMGAFSDRWSNGAQLWWVLAGPGDRMTLPLQVEQAGEYELVGFFTRAQDYGIVRLLVNGEQIGALMDGYHPEVETTGPISFGRISLEAGPNELAIEIVGKDARSAGYSNGYLVGIDGFLLY